MLSMSWWCPPPGNAGHSGCKQRRCSRGLLRAVLLTLALASALAPADAGARAAPIPPRARKGSTPPAPPALLLTPEDARLPKRDIDHIPLKKNLKTEDLIRSGNLTRMSWEEARDRLTPEQLDLWMGPALKEIEDMKAKGVGGKDILYDNNNATLGNGTRLDVHGPGRRKLLLDPVTIALIGAAASATLNQIFNAIASALRPAEGQLIYSALWDGQVLDSGHRLHWCCFDWHWVMDVGTWEENGASWQKFSLRQDGRSQFGSLAFPGSYACAQAWDGAPNGQFRVTTCNWGGNQYSASFSAGPGQLRLVNRMSGQPLFRIHMQAPGGAYCLTAHGRNRRENTFQPCGNRLDQLFYASNRPSQYPSKTSVSILMPNHYLRCGPHHNLGTPDGSHRLVMQCDGNLVLYRNSDNRARWASYTHYQSTNVDTPPILAMQEDGNLVIYDRNYNARWATGTWGTRARLALLLEDGPRLVVRVVESLDSGLPLYQSRWSAGLWF